MTGKRLISKIRPALLLLTPLTLAGCYDITTDFVVSGDGSGTFSGAFEVDVEAIEDLDGTCDGFLQGFIEEDNGLTNGEYEVVNNADRCDVLFDGEWASGEPILDGDAQTQEDFTLTPTAAGNGWRFEAVVADPDDEAEELEGPLEFATIHISVEMPGEIIDHNGELSEGVVSWELSALMPDPATVFVVSTVLEESTTTTSVLEESTTTSSAAPTTTVTTEEIESDSKDETESEDEDPVDEVSDEGENSLATDDEQLEDEESEEALVIEDGSSSSALMVVLLVALVALISGGAAFLFASRRSTGTPQP